MLDMNAAYDLPACIEFARVVAPYNIFWLEEPLHWYLQPADFALLAKATPIPLAHGEREWTRFTTRDFMTLGGIRFVQFDATRYAGFTEALRVAHMADHDTIQQHRGTAQYGPDHQGPGGSSQALQRFHHRAIIALNKTIR